ncbi:MAG: hypothetical protein KTM48_00550, partial [Wolbachia endosymbiont of Pissodes strobi]|nr:hypothetical protein [Wolbachia endosymbiont of Pissodes strobi]
ETKCWVSPSQINVKRLPTAISDERGILMEDHIIPIGLQNEVFLYLGFETQYYLLSYTTVIKPMITYSALLW